MAKDAKAPKDTKIAEATVAQPTMLPRATEKAYHAQTQNTYIFVVPRQAGKLEIAATIAKEYNVTVVDVRTLLRKGKPTRFSRGKHAYPGTTYRQDKKIAYVTLKDGDKIPVFEEPAEETQDTKVSAKEAKAAEKAATKEAKKAAKADKKADKENK